MKKIILLFIPLLVCVFGVTAQQIQESALKQMASLQREKEARTPAQKKMDSQLWYALKMERGERITADVATLSVKINKGTNGRVPVEITGNVTPALLKGIAAAGGEVISSSEKFQSVYAKIPLVNLEKVAALADVRFLGQYMPPQLVSATKPTVYNEHNIATNYLNTPFKVTTTLEERKSNLKKQLLNALANKYFIGSATSEGDITHKAALARTTFGVNGAGIKIGIMSDSYNSLGGAAANVSSGDLPGAGNPNGFTTPVTVLSDIPDGSDEGRAMVQIVHDLAPGAQLYFATAYDTQADFAQHILDLKNAGCTIICDDVFYYAEGVFQDGIVAQAVNTVTAAGVTYFSSAGNQGNKNDGVSTVWEGDFVDGGALAVLPGGTVNDFGSGVLSNGIVSNGGLLNFSWSDPLGASSNDYDVFVLNSGLTAVVGFSSNVQNGTQDPYEQLNGQAAGNRVVIFKKTGAATRALHLNGFNQGANGFTITTQGQTSGHSAAVAAFSMAATPATSNGFGGPNGPYPGSFVGTNVVQTFSSDGPRRVFYNATGTAITPGNLLFGTNGGTVRQKPDLTAANGVVTSGFDAISGLNPFFGTSAAAPHAAAITALLKQFIPTLTTAQIRTILTTTAIDIESAGVDRDAGYGIVMAFEAINGSCVPGFTAQPGNISVCAGNPYTFTVTTVGAAPITYQWQISTDNGASWTSIGGATANNYTVPAVALTDNGKQFRVIATGSCGSNTSNAAILTVTSTTLGGTITSNPASGTVCTGSGATLTLAGQAGNIIRWEFSTNGGGTWTNIANTTTTLTIPTLSQTTQYRALVQSVGCAAVYSNVVTLTSITAVGALTISANPGTTLCQGDPALLTVGGLQTFPFTSTGAVSIPTSGSGPGTPYPSTIAVTGLPTTGITVSSVTLNGLSHTYPSDIDIVLQSPSGQNVILMSDIGAGTAISNVNYTFKDGSPALVAGFNPSGTYKCTNLVGTLGVEPDNWPAPGPLTAPSATTLTTFTGDPNGTWKLFVVDDFTGDGGSLTSFNITFAGVAPLGSGYTFSWAPAAGLNSTTINPVAAAPAVSTTYTVTVTNSAGCTGTASIPITVNVRPGITAQPAATTVCERSTATFTATAVGTNAVLQWQESTNGGTSYTNITNGGIYSGATTGTLTITGVTAAMNNNLYRLSVSGTCPPVANSNAVKLTVNAGPTLTVTPTSGCGGVAGTNGTQLTASGNANTYSWSPVAGLYTNANATTAYTGTSITTVYAAPTAFTSYIVTGTNTATGCTSIASAAINYTPTAPVIIPSPANLCIPDSIIMLTKAQPKTLSFASGTINLPIIDDNIGGTNHSMTVSGVPAGATITSVVVKLDATHTYAGDLVIALKAPNGKILNLDYCLSQTNNGTGILAPIFVNTLVNSAGGASFGAGTQPYTGTYAADAATSASFFGAPTGPTGFDATTGLWSDLYGTPNGTWTLAWADVFGGGDVGTFKDWSLDITYQVGTPSTPPVWTPVTGLYINAAATIPYVAGTPKDTVWAKVPKTPLPGSYNYQVTSNSLPPASSTATTNFADNNGFGLVTFNVKNNNSYAVRLTDIASVVFFLDAHNVSAFYKTSAINGPTGQITTANGWNQFGSGSIVGTGLVQPFMSGLTLVIPAGATYGIAVQAEEVGFGADIDYSTIAAGTYTFTSGGCSIIAGTNISYGGDLAPTEPINSPRGFIGSVTFAPVPPPACTSPAGLVKVTINDSVKIVTQPVNASACMDKATSFTVAATGTGLTYQWQVSTDNGATFSNVTNGGVYAGATTATLTITAPPASMGGYIYHVLINGISPCGGKVSANKVLTVNPFPSVVIGAAPSTKLFPGLRTVLFSTVSPVAASYTWFRNGAVIPNATASSLVADITGMGDYTLQVTDVNGCTAISNLISITDSSSSKLFIYPNPNNGQFQVRYYTVPGITGIPGGINVYDSRGKRVLTNKYTAPSAYARMDVNLSNFSSGVYWIELVDLSGNRLATSRVEVVR